MIKTATSLRDAGAEVRIFAVARARSGYPEGHDTVGPDVPVQRAPEFELVRYAPWLVDVARRVLGRAAPSAAAAAPPSTTTTPDLPAAPVSSAAPSLRQRALAVGNDLWLRGFRTAEPGALLA